MMFGCLPKGLQTAWRSEIFQKKAGLAAYEITTTKKWGMLLYQQEKNLCIESLEGLVEAIVLSQWLYAGEDWPSNHDSHLVY